MEFLGVLAEWVSKFAAIDAILAGFILIGLGIRRLVRILKKENPSAFERQVQEIWHRVVG